MSSLLMITEGCAWIFIKTLIQIYLGNWAASERVFDIPLGCLCFVMIHLGHSQVNLYPKPKLNFLGSQIK